MIPFCSVNVINKFIHSPKGNIFTLISFLSSIIFNIFGYFSSIDIFFLLLMKFIFIKLHLFKTSEFFSINFDFDILKFKINEKQLPIVNLFLLKFKLKEFLPKQAK